jgi:hypothetical protein
MTIAFIPITFLIILVSGGNVIRNSIFSFAWVYAWDPVLATINGIVNIAAIAKVKAALNAAAVYNNALNGEWMGYSIQALNIMYSTLDYIPSVAGYLAISTPGIAYMLIKGGEVTMASIASMMAAPVMSAPTHAEAASSLETQKIAQQTGKSFGQVEMQYNAAGQAKLNAMVFQGQAAKRGYNDMLTTEMGAFDYGFAQKKGLGDVVDRLGEQGVAGMTYKQTMMGAAKTEGEWKGGGSNLENLQHAAELETQKRLNFANQVKTDYVGPGGAYVERKDGSITDVKISNLDTNLEFSQRDARTRSAARDLASNTEVSKGLSENKDLSFGKEELKRHSDTLQKEYSHALRDRMINSQNEFKFMGSNEERETFFSILKAEGNLKFISGEAGIKAEAIKSDGSSVGLTFTGSDAERFTELSREAREDALVKTASTKEGLGYVSQLAEKVEASTAYRDLTAAQSDEAVSRKMSIDVAPEILEHVRKTEYGYMDDKNFAREAALNKIQNWRENDPAKLNDVFKTVTDAKYNKLKPSDFDSLTSEVKSEIKTSEGLKTQAETTANRAETKTAGITEDKLKADPRTGVKGPDEEGFDKRYKGQQDAQKRATARRKGKEGPPTRG